MQALVYDGLKEPAWKSVPDPKLIEPTDAIVRIDMTTICGTESAHPERRPSGSDRGTNPRARGGRHRDRDRCGRALSGRRRSRAGFLCLAVRAVPILSRCAVRPVSQRRRLDPRDTIDGLQAEYARIPFADNSLYHLPDGMSDEQAVYLSDVLPTGYEVGVLNGHVQPGDVIAVVGGGPIGLSAI